MSNGKNLFAVCSSTLLATMVAGCATNDIRFDRAATMTKSGREATNATRALMNDIKAENRIALIELVASDANCEFPEIRIAYGKPFANSVLCRKGELLAGDFVMTRLMKRDFAPSLAAIDGLVAYFDAIDAIVTREPLDLDGDFAEAEGTLQGVFSDMATVAGHGTTTLPTLNEDQRAAVGGVLSLLGELVDKAQRVDDLRQIDINLDQVAIVGSLDSLDSANNHWVRGLEAQIDNRLMFSRRRLPEIPLGQYEVRKTAAAEQLLLIERQESLPELRLALHNTVEALRKARVDYRNLLFNIDKTLTGPERKKQAAITRTRLRAALASLASVIRAF